MCLVGREETKIKSVSAYKIFNVANGLLYSPFKTANEGFEGGCPPFALNEEISVVPEDKTFFSFKELEQAISLASSTLFHGSKLVVKMVTAIDVIATGYFRVPSNDPQCLDGYYPSFESKRLIVHDTIDSNRYINAEIVERLLKSTSLSYVEKELIRFVI